MSDIVLRSTVRELVAAFQEAESTVRSSFAALVAAEQRLAIFGEPRISIDATYQGRDCRFEDADRAIERMSRQAWRCIVEHLNLRAAMSIARWKDLDEQLNKGELPPITEENVGAFAVQFEDKLPQMLAESVAEVFEWLRPIRSKYKTNSELEIPPKVILGWVVERWYSGYHVHHYKSQHLTALENVFSMLDGRGQINKHFTSALEQAIQAAKDGRGETTYFKFRACDNRNLHLSFKRLDLLKRFNQIAGGTRLRPAAA